VSSARLPLPVDALPADLVAALRDADVADATIYLAHETTRWLVGDADAPDRRALALLVIALLEARADGSTRLPLGAVDERLARLGVAAADREACARLAASLSVLQKGPSEGPLDPPRSSAVGPSPPAITRLPGLDPLFGAPGAHRPFIVEDGALATHRDWLIEERLAASLAGRLARPPTRVDAGDLDAAVARAAAPGRRWTAEQERALRAALVQPLTIVTGGPGTGKTALVAGILRALAALSVPAGDVALAAPTGKAANRIAELLRAELDPAAAPFPEPLTLHRLLGFRGGRPRLGGGEFRHHENYPLPHRLVLVDEASMVDLALMERLARAVRPDARLVLLGDADQLPSVDAGAVFHDLTRASPRARPITLTESHRMNPGDPAGAAVLAAARAVKAGNVTALELRARARPADLEGAGVEHLEPAGPAPAADRRLLGTFLDWWMEARVRALPDHDELCARLYRLGSGGAEVDARDAPALGALLAHHQKLRVLALTRGAGAPTGADALNAALVRRAGARAAGDAAGPRGELAPGTPVLMSRNDYERGLFNGDQGVTVRAAPPGDEPRLWVAFPRRGALAMFPFTGLGDDLRVAYATTVHKAQGTELEHAALVLPERDLPLLARELLYTALTRARRGVVVVGRRALLERGAARPLERASGLAARLARASAETTGPE
jgi:exodeoxyribonuclease V alpha subunit